MHMVTECTLIKTLCQQTAPPLTLHLASSVENHLWCLKVLFDLTAITELTWEVQSR